MTDNSTYDVIIVGAGVVGAASARELAPDHDVLVLERDNVACGASGVAGGTVAPTLFFHELPDVARHANAFFREFDGTGQFSFAERPRVELVSDGEESAARRKADRLSSAGFPVSYLDAEAAEERYPSLDFSAFTGAIEVRDTGQVDPHTYTTALGRDAVERGAELRTGVSVTDLVVEGGRIEGVETTEGAFRAETVVAAAGWRTNRLLEGYAEVPVEPYRTQCVILSPDDPLDERIPLGRRVDEGLYFCPQRNGNLLVGGGSGGIDDPVGASRSEDESFKRQVADVVPRFVRGFEDAAFVDGWAGIAGMVRDGRPIVDSPANGPRGLVVALASVLGIMGSPAIAAAVRSRVTDESCPFDRDAFSLDRFDSPTGSFDVHSVSSGHYDA